MDNKISNLQIGTLSVPRIIYEDDSILVIDKPAGMIVNKADTTRAYLTVQEWVEQRSTKDTEGDRTRLSSTAIEPTSEFPNEFENRGGIVHRLDKETSGIMIIAKNEKSFVNLQDQFKSRVVKKTYTALVHGDLIPEEGEVNVPIGRLPWNRTKFGFLTEGRESKTLYKKLWSKRLVVGKEDQVLSLVEVYPQTGRTHQIRVHMRYINFPIFADELYAGRKMMKKDRKILNRHFLHASKIKFNHPISGEKIELESELPPELKDLLSSLVD